MPVETRWEKQVIMLHDYKDKAVLITGGTRGIGLETALVFARAGAQVYLTYGFGSADDDEVRGRFAAIGAHEPCLMQADASHEEDTLAVVAKIKERHERVDMFMSNVTVVPSVGDVQSFTKKDLFRSMDYSTWPLVDYLQQIKATFGVFPRYVIAMSTDGIDHYYKNYDYVALSKGVVEVFVRYLTRHLRDEDVRINAIRTRNVLTESCLDMHGRDYPAFIKKYYSDAHFIDAKEVGNTVYAMCSGMLDALKGQTISVDRGAPFSDNVLSVYHGAGN